MSGDVMRRADVGLRENSKIISRPLPMQAISTAERAQQGALQQAVQSGESNGNGSGAPQRMDDPLLVDPESFTLQPGELCTFSNGAGIHPEDVFRCSGCSLPECQASC